MNAFWDAVQEFGGEVTGAETYIPNETDFRQPIDKLSGLYYMESRQRELDALAKAREENKIKKRTRKTEQYFSLKPIADYDAVFIPDDYKMAGQILPTFAYRDVDNVKFLGTSNWHSPELVSRLQGVNQAPYFVDAFDAESSSPQVTKFITRYRSTFNQDPTAMEAIAYDAASILSHVIADRSARTRGEIRDNLKSIFNYPGVTGKISYKHGQLLRNLTIFTIKAGKIVETR